MKISGTWSPLKTLETEKEIKVTCDGREYNFNNSPLLTSILTDNEELLTAPIRIVGEEHGKEMKFEDLCTFVHSAEDEKTILCSSVQTDCVVFNTAITVEYDGFINFDVKVMPKGLTMEQCFLLDDSKPKEVSLDKLWIEIPLRNNIAQNYHVYPSNGVQYSWETGAAPNFRKSGKLRGNISMPFNPIIWLGNAEKGLSLFMESDEHWQSKDWSNVIEIVKTDKETVIRLKLLDSMPADWSRYGEHIRNAKPISFKFMLQATPVKVFPKNPYGRKILHIDCFKKIYEDYIDFLENPFEDTGEITYDRMKRLGVNTLILHEKWNLYQNFWEMPLQTKIKTKKIVEECHKRGIKVIPYFGFELSSLNPYFSESTDVLLDSGINGAFSSAWYRRPWQRDYAVCYGSRWSNKFLEGFKKLYDEMNFDGIYLDSLLKPKACKNIQHGCGYEKPDGSRGLSYPIQATREFMKQLYAFVNEKGGTVTSHLSDCMNTASLSFVHVNWDGENMQTSIKTKGPSSIPQELIITQYIGRNIGVPVEMLAYEYPPNWTFDKALAFSLIYGILPRPNDTGKPLEIMSKIWRIIDNFSIDNALWIPYYKNNELIANNENVFVSYYEYNNDKLVFISNLSEKDVACCIHSVNSIGRVISCLSDCEHQATDNQFDIEMKGFETQIYRVN